MKLRAVLLFLAALVPGVQASEYRLVGEAELTFMFLSVYHSRLYSEDGSYQAGQLPLLMEIEYQLPVKGEALVQRTAREWEHLGLEHAQQEHWLQTLGILGGRRHVPIVFVGHSMSGAALFYFREGRWSQQRVARCALAPALLMNDLLRKGFYRTLGAGIWAGARLQLERFSEMVSPLVINQLISGASKAVQAEHERIFKVTDQATLASTFYAMGQAKCPARKVKWDLFKVLLGHSDRLVGLDPMLELLTELRFRSRQIRVVLGDHYFFSVGQHSRRLHSEGREIALEEIRALVKECRR
jgi:hypothetical protein